MIERTNTLLFTPFRDKDCNKPRVKVVMSGEEQEPHLIKEGTNRVKFKHLNTDKTTKKLYYKAVWLNTELNSIYIKDIHLRGQAYHIDHIIPISYGFKHGISPLIIGGLDNLQILSHKENFKKNAIYPYYAQE